MLDRDLVLKRFELNEELKKLEEQEKAIKENKQQLDQQISEIDAILLNEMKQSDLTEVKVGDLFVNYFCKHTVGYTSDSDVLKYLKDNNLTDLITTKITEALNKKALNKELKTNTNLKETLDKFIINKETAYVTVTSEENHKRMLEHIEAGK